MNGLFGSFSEVAEPIALPDADVRFFEGAISQSDSAKYFQNLLSQTPWRQEDVVVWGKRHKQPRLVAWYGDQGAAYKYSGISLEPLPWTPTLLALKEVVETLAATTFNSVLLNLYRNQNDSMGWHSDDEPALGPRPVIASVSLGQTREFQLKHKTRKDLPITRIDLSDGSLLVMAGPTQEFWQHSVKREAAAMGQRVNLTFRRIMRHGELV